MFFWAPVLTSPVLSAFPCLACCTHLKLFQSLLVFWNLFSWLLSHNYSIRSSAKFSSHNGMIWSSLNSKKRLALASRDFGSYFTCLPAKCLPRRQKQTLCMSFLMKKWKLLGENTRECGEELEETRSGTDCWGHTAKDWGHALGRRDTSEGLWPMEHSHQGRDSPEELQRAGDPCWSSNSEKNRVEEKTSKKCGRGAETIRSLHVTTITHNPASHTQTLI